MREQDMIGKWFFNLHYVYEWIDLTHFHLYTTPCHHCCYGCYCCCCSCYSAAVALLPSYILCSRLWWWFCFIFDFVAETGIIPFRQCTVTVTAPSSIAQHIAYILCKTNSSHMMCSVWYGWFCFWFNFDFLHWLIRFKLNKNWIFARKPIIFCNNDDWKCYPHNQSFNINPNGCGFVAANIFVLLNFRFCLVVAIRLMVIFYANCFA